MSTPNDEALNCADAMELVHGAGHADAVRHIRHLVAENTAQRELLRQAVEALQAAYGLWLASNYANAGCCHRRHQRTPEGTAMSKITPPPALTQDHITEGWWTPDEAPQTPREGFEAGAKFGAAARDRQWQDMLAQQVPSQAASDAYDRIDRFLRKNLGDVDYASFSFDLDLVYAAPVAQQASAPPPAPTDTIRVACITLDGSTLTVPVKNLADVVPDLISETGDVYTLTIKEMTVAEYEALGEFNGF